MNKSKNDKAKEVRKPSKCVHISVQQHFAFNMWEQRKKFFE